MATLSLVIAIASIRRARLLTAILTAKQLPHATAAIAPNWPTVFRYGSTTTIFNATTPASITVDQVKDALPLEITALVIVILLVLLILFHAYQIFHSNPQTAIRLLVVSRENHHKFVDINWFALPHSILAYDITVTPPNQLKFTLPKCPRLWINLPTNFTGFRICHIQTQSPVLFPPKVKISWRTAVRIDKMLKGPHYLAVIALNKNLDELFSAHLTHTVIHKADGNTELNEQPRPTPEAPSLYPTLP